jgi:N-hydroxyarylamine O-acetyltransferase
MRRPSARVYIDSPVVLDLDAYLARIGLRGQPSVAGIHRAHATSVPFENLDPQRGLPVSLAPEDLERKLVSERRGGYCFEQNLLLKAALESIGAEVEMLLARVRLGGPPGVIRPRSHLVLRVRADGETWHADVGFGMGTLLEPLPFGPGAEHGQSGWRFRVVEDGRELVLQSYEEERWIDLYGLLDDPVPMIDVETVNWWTSTSPRSPFVTGLMVSSQAADGSRTSLSDWGELALTERTPSLTTVSPVTRAELPALLAERFALRGFAVGPDDRLVLAEELGRR